MKKYEFVASSLRSEITKGYYPTGAALPTEEQLREIYGVSRQTIRQALDILVEEQLITKRQGSGSTVSRRRTGIKSGIIAVVATYIDDYIFPSQLRAVEEVLTMNNYTAVIMATRNRVSNERAILSSLLEKPIEGVLIEGTKTAMPNPNADLYEELFNRNIPVVFFNSYYPDLKGTISVTADNIGGGAMLVKELSRKGHKNIAGIFKSDDIQGHQRYKGFIDALYSVGNIIPDEKVIWYSTETKDNLFTHPDRTLARLGDSTAVVCYNDEIALALIKFLIANKKRVPEDISVVSFDDSNLSENSPVRISSLSCESRNVAAVAARKLINVINGQRMQSETIPWKLISKDSH